MNALELYRVDIRRSRRRRTLCLTVVDGGVRLNAPVYVPKKTLEIFVAEKVAWLEAQLEAQRHIEVAKNEKFEMGGTFYYCGMPLILKEDSGLSIPELQDGALCIPSTHRSRNRPATRKKNLAAWLKHRAEEALATRVVHFEQLMNLKAKKFSTRLYKLRWGSCDRHGHIQLNWLLMMAPTEIQDYVVIHELAHLRYFDHSADFWSLVERHCPDYRVHCKWLKQQHILFW